MGLFGRGTTANTQVIMVDERSLEIWLNCMSFNVSFIYWNQLKFNKKALSFTHKKHRSSTVTLITTFLPQMFSPVWITELSQDRPLQLLTLYSEKALSEARDFVMWNRKGLLALSKHYLSTSVLSKFVKKLNVNCIITGNSEVIGNLIWVVLALGVLLCTCKQSQ